ncbi:hypothetical protein KBB96_05085 [Luteolibacter ambystomatis]|uniref:Uncharacterized protein n=2 Tax=Luteolibacter ambystomatis TaxID=2824561 RepID=A0A975J1F3_9BACT|nr:hypothetical protein [Luteolibacter ambystomatis]QUE52267.1 hypothetical protein KBB96_05085 [Luteolibacter ambystomatis]
MKKIGTTTTGNFIIEVTKEEYDALLQTNDQPDASQAKAKGMSHSELVTYAADRLRKLAPKRRDGVIRSIEAMFQFNGGITAAEIEKLVASLQKRKFFAITADGKVSYLGT